MISRLEGDFLYRFCRFTNEEKVMIAVTMDFDGVKNNIFSWNMIFYEVLYGTKLGRLCLKKLKEKGEI